MSKDPLDLDPLPSDSPPQLHDNDAHNDKSDDFAKDQERSRTYNDRQEEKNDDSDDDDVLLEFSLSEVHSSLPAECPFTFLHLSSEDSTKDDAVDEDVQDCSLPNAPSTKQGTSHVPFTAEEVLRSNGQERKGWIDAGRTELNNLTGAGTTPISLLIRRSSLERLPRPKDCSTLSFQPWQFLPKNLTKRKSGS